MFTWQRLENTVGFRGLFRRGFSFAGKACFAGTDTVLVSYGCSKNYHEWGGLNQYIFLPKYEISEV